MYFDPIMFHLNGFDFYQSLFIFVYVFPKSALLETDYITHYEHGLQSGCDIYL